MRAAIEYIGIVVAIFLAIVLFGDDCHNANKAGDRIGRWLDSDLPALTPDAGSK